MKTHWIFNHWLPKLFGVQAITLYPFIFLAPRLRTPEGESVWTPDMTSLVLHEWVHVRDVRAQGWLRFYAVYVWQYVVGLVKTGSRAKAYHGTDAEKKAYAEEGKILLGADELLEMVGGFDP